MRSVTSMSVSCIETQPHVSKETSHCNGVSAHTRSLIDPEQSFISLRSSKWVEISSRENTRVLTELIPTRVKRARPLNLRKNEGVLVVYSHKKSNNRDNSLTKFKLYKLNKHIITGSRTYSICVHAHFKITIT